MYHYIMEGIEKLGSADVKRIFKKKFRLIKDKSDIELL